MGDELAVLGLDLGDLHGHPGVLAGSQAGADLEAEQAAAEQRVAVAAVIDDLGHDVDDGLGKAFGALCRETPSWRRTEPSVEHSSSVRSSPPTTTA